MLTLTLIRMNFCFKGVPSLGVLPLDPLELKTLVIEQGDGPVSIKLDFKDLFIHGIASAVITSVT